MSFLYGRLFYYTFGRQNFVDVRIQAADLWLFFSFFYSTLLNHTLNSPEKSSDGMASIYS